MQPAMRPLHAHLLFVLTTLSTASMAQEPRTETLETKTGTPAQITSTVTGMYGGTTSEKADAAFSAGQKAHQAGDLENAEKNYLKAIKEDKNFVEAYDNLGQVYRQMKKFDKAVDYYSRSIELYPQGHMARMNIAVVYGLMDNYAAARTQYEALVQYHPEDAEGYFGLANTAMVQGDLEAAETHAKKALDIYRSTGSDHLADGYYLLGMIQHYRKNEVEARQNLQQAKDLGARLHPTLEKEVFGTATADPENSLRMETPADYERLEPQVIAAFDWLMTTPVNEKTEDRREISAFLMTWITGSPSVTIEISEGLVPYIGEPECLMIFMGGYTKYALQNKSNMTKEDAALFGTERVIEFYQANTKALGKNKEIEKLITLQKEGRLKGYIKEQG
jgi:Flp pilus assembly protein TadD